MISDAISESLFLGILLFEKIFKNKLKIKKMIIVKTKDIIFIFLFEYIFMISPPYDSKFLN